MTIVCSPCVKEVLKVPTEIVKFVVLNHLKITGLQFEDPGLWDTPSLFLKTPLHHLNEFMGIDTIWDNILAAVKKELIFDEPIFQSKQLNNFVEFVLDKSIKIHLQAPLRIKLNKIGIELLHHGCCEYTSRLESSDSVSLDDNNLRFITFLECAVDVFGDLLKVTEDLRLLDRLTRLKISRTSSSQMD
ncbi:unnamed protein product [Ambrosiozyma monospora]|uniref:Unnamed protein product n=1 Tax=Ambrosiozyma monospora TaxID=43982 RepID=A0ACB5U2M9_AMBMO|nr:unnamed protein product [Ambrosiozyma monospora]